MNRKDKPAPDNSVFHQILSNFQQALRALHDDAGVELMKKDFNSERIVRALSATLLAEAFDVAVTGLGAEECARFISAITNEHLRSWQSEDEDDE